MPDYTMHVISHTHWDREWYRTFQGFRMRLVDLVDNLLNILENEPGFKYFNFDGQTIVLEDYLEIRPHKRAILEKHIREGRILVGPWYQLNDEFLVSGESTVRSLLIGHRIAQEFGAIMKVGYLPDQFGNISQMPQILNGFGIDNAIFGRGLQLVNDRKMEFYWESPDGSKVITSFMAFWYNNAQRFPDDTDAAVQYTENIKNTMKGVSHIDQLLLMNGVDHLEAQPGLSDIIARVNPKIGGDKLVHSTMPAYIEAMKEAVKRCGVELDTVVGEFREDRHSSILAGTLSSRIYIKQANERCQTALERYTEPAASFAYVLGADYPQDYLNYTWKLLMENHPHDSICGCSIDQTHKEMMPRFEQVEQVTGELTDCALKNIAGRIKTDGDSLVVYNPLNWERTDKVCTTLDFPIGDPDRGRPVVDPARNFAMIKFLDESGNDVPFALISAKTMPITVYAPDELPLGLWIRRFEVELLAENIPSCGYRTYKIEKCAMKPAYEGNVAAEAYWDNALANEFVRLSVRGGTISLERLDMSEDGPIADAYNNINMFEDVGDIGDEYVHTRPVDDVTVTSLDANPQVTIINRNPISATYKVDLTMTLPANGDRINSTRTKETVECPVTSYLTVTRGIPRVDIRTVINNQAKDHRVRVLFPTGIAAETSFAEGQYDVVERSVGIPSDWINGSPFYPQQAWVDVCNDERGLCVINKGLPEYEVYKDEGRTVGVTLLRCTDRISAGGETGGLMMAEEAQCIGEYAFEYAVYPHAGNWQDAQVWKQAHQHNVPLMTVQTGAHNGDLPLQYSFLQTSNAEMVISAVKKAEDSDLLVVRFYNTTDDTIEGGWVKVVGAKGAKLLNMNEEVIGDVNFADEKVTLDVAPKKIVTLGFEVR
ncbi:MAG: alpha-mannosidase [Armatimonadota bacterium]